MAGSFRTVSCFENRNATAGIPYDFLIGAV
jgi:hypothetical protein